MIKFENLNKFIREKEKILIRFKDYEIKEPTVKEWIYINTLNFEQDFRETSKKMIKIMIPDLECDILTNLEIGMCIDKCLKVLSGNNSNEGKEKIRKDEKQSDEDVTISFSYLVAKFCRYMNTSLEETLSMNAFIFFELLESIEVVIAEESLRIAEIFDNHIHLKTKNGHEKYKKTLNKYRDIYQKKGIKVLQGIDIEGLKNLKNMLGG